MSKKISGYITNESRKIKKDDIKECTFALYKF